jgi:hypothetical protein
MDQRPNIKSETIQLVKEQTGKIFQDVTAGNE